MINVIAVSMTITDHASRIIDVYINQLLVVGWTVYRCSGSPTMHVMP